MTSLLGNARALRLVGTTPRSVGREAWRATMRASMTSTSRPLTQSGPAGMERMAITMEGLRAYQAKQREIASRISPGEIARAEALGDRRAEVCPKCDGARYVGVQMTPGAMVTAVPCECMPLEERAQRAGIPRMFQGATLATFERRDGSAHARQYALRWDGRGSVVLWGANGTGKTRLGCGMLLERLARGFEARFLSAADLMDDLRARFGNDSESSQEYSYRISREPILMLDDVGAEQDSPFSRTTMATLIDRRYRSELPTILTTNLTHRDIAERYGRRLADRLYLWSFIEVGGGSVRRERALA